MLKKNFKKPDKNDLVSGNILDIYSDSRSDNSVWLGKAVLLERRASSYSDETPFIKYEVGGTKNREPQIIVWSRQRWLVEFVEGPLTGHKTCRYIGYFECVGIECLKSLNS